MLAPSRSWFRGLLVGVACGAVLGVATVSRSTSRSEAVLARLAEHLLIVDEPLNGLAGPHLIFEGVNVHVRSGSGSTDDGLTSGGALTGLGNLVVGYNEPPLTLAEGDRGGSPTLVMGVANRHRSFAGLVAGNFNTVGAPYATVTGGSRNHAAAEASSISGGANQTAAVDFCWRVESLNEGC
jgi:hypothetical protein